jgi:hypothetical protein
MLQRQDILRKLGAAVLQRRYTGDLLIDVLDEEGLPFIASPYGECVRGCGGEEEGGEEFHCFVACLCDSVCGYSVGLLRLKVEGRLVKWEEKRVYG